MRRALLAGLAALLLVAPAASARVATACDPFASRACLMRFPNDMNLTAPRTTPAARRQKAEFQLTGNVVDVGGGQPCQASGATSP